MSVQTLPRCRPTNPSACDEITPSTEESPPPLRTVLTKPVLISIANYGVLAISDIAFFALVPLFFATPIALGGLGLPPATIGFILGALGIIDGVLQALLFARAVRRWGPKRVYQAGLLMFIPMYALFPVMSTYAKAHGVTPVVWVLVFVQMVLLVIMDLAFGECYAVGVFEQYSEGIGSGAIFIFVSSSAPDSRCLGAVNGVAQFVASVTRAIGPAASTSLFATSLERNWLGGYAVYLILVVFSVGLFFVSISLPRNMWPKKKEPEES